ALLRVGVDHRALPSHSHSADCKCGEREFLTQRRVHRCSSCSKPTVWFPMLEWSRGTFEPTFHGCGILLQRFRHELEIEPSREDRAVLLLPEGLLPRSPHRVSPLRERRDARIWNILKPSADRQ